MIQKQTVVRIGDNSGAKRARVFFVYKSSLNTHGLARKVLVSLRKVVPNNAKKLKKGDKMQALIVQEKRPYCSGIYFCKSFFNTIVLLKKGEDDLPLGTRIYVRISKYARYKGYNRLFLLSKGLF